MAWVEMDIEPSIMEVIDKELMNMVKFEMFFENFLLMKYGLSIQDFEEILKEVKPEKFV